MISNEIIFEDGKTAPITLPRGVKLSEYLDIRNSSLLFGCRTGLCGTCVIEITGVRNGELSEPDEDEKELLEVIAKDCPGARLACQINLSADLTIRKIEET